MDFFEPYISTASLASTSTLAAVSKCNGFQRGTQTRWQLVANDGIGAPTLTDMGASFSILTGRVLTLFIAAPPNGSSVWARVVDEVSRAVPSGTPTVRHRMHDETDSLQNTSPRSRPFSVAQRSLGTANTLFRQVMVGGPDYD